MFMQNYGALTIDNMTIDGTGIPVVTYASSYGTPWGGTAKPQFNYNTAGSSVIRNSTITMPGDLSIDDAAGLTIEDDAVINVNAIVTKGTDDRYTSANPTIAVENGAKFTLTNADKATAFEALLNANGQTLGTPVNGVYTVKVAPVHRNDIGYTTLAGAIAALVNGDIIKLNENVSMTDNIVCSLESEETFKLNFNNHSIARNGNNVMLTEGVTVQTNVQTQLFAAAEGYVVVESNTSTEYPWEYSVKMSLANSNISVTVDPATYNGAAQEPNVTVKKNGVTDPLVQVTDYTISYKGGNDYSHLVNADTYVEEIIITGTGNYGGKIYADFTIDPRHINDVNYSGHTQVYAPAGYAVDDIKGLIALTYNSKTLERTTDSNNTKDYTVSVADGPGTDGKYITPGTYPGVITLTAEEGEGKNFVGTRTIDFIIRDAINIADCDITATTIYNGAAQDPTGTSGSANVVVKNGTTVVDPSNYVITYIGEGTPGYTNAGTYSIRVSAKAESTTYYGSKDVEYVINPKSITSNDIVIVNETNFAGTVIDPTTVVTVKDNAIGADGTMLTKGTDYSITAVGYTYQNPDTYTNAITITGMGNYTGTVTKDFIIKPNGAVDLANAAVVISKQTYTGADLKPTAATTTVTVNGQALSSDDYNFSFVQEGDNFYKDAKVYSNAIIITASTTQTTYYGTAVGNYIIEPRDLSDAGITVTTTDIDYNNAEHNVTVTVTYKANANDEGNIIPATNYTFDPTKVTEAGTYTITVNAVENSNLVGSTTTTQKVTKSLAGTYATDFTVSPDPIPTQTATGSEIKPTIVVKDKDREMIKTDEYTLSYANNTDEGTATITITGAGVYSGTKLVNFTIVNEFFVLEGITYHHANEGEEVTVGKKDGDNYVPAIASDLAPKVTIPSTVTYQNKVFTVVGADEKAFGNAAITALTLPSTIKSITPSAFEGSTNMRYVDATAATELTPNSLDRTISGTTFYGVPKQSLVFLNGNTITGENYIYKVGDNDFRCDVLKIYDDVNGNQQGFTEADGYKWAYENKYDFTANTIENTRQLKAGQHYTVCLPYDLPIPSTLKAYTLDASSSTILGFKEVTGTLEAFTPYVVIASGTGNLLSISTGGQVPATTFASDDAATRLTPAGAGTTNYVLVGTMRYMDGNAAQGNYIMQGDKTWKKIASDSNFNGPCILPMRAYIAPMASIPGSGARLTATFTNADGSTTAISDLQLDNDGDDTFDLQGRKVNGQSAAKGVYIKNGKKLYK